MFHKARSDNILIICFSSSAFTHHHLQCVKKNNKRNPLRCRLCQCSSVYFVPTQLLPFFNEVQIPVLFCFSQSEVILIKFLKSKMESSGRFWMKPRAANMASCCMKPLLWVGLQLLHCWVTALGCRVAYGTKLRKCSLMKVRCVCGKQYMLDNSNEMQRARDFAFILRWLLHSR